jgi:hypothetical protein
MVALIAMVTVAELLLGEAVVNGDSGRADAIARLNRRVPR